jgi:hypothetical protein
MFKMVNIIGSVGDNMTVSSTESKYVNVLAGYKTYIVAAVTALVGVYNLTTKVHASSSSIEAFLGAGGLAALRAAIAKVEAALKTTK